MPIVVQCLADSVQSTPRPFPLEQSSHTRLQNLSTCLSVLPSRTHGPERQAPQACNMCHTATTSSEGRPSCFHSLKARQLLRAQGSTPAAQATGGTAAPAGAAAASRPHQPALLNVQTTGPNMDPKQCSLPPSHIRPAGSAALAAAAAAPLLLLALSKVNLADLCTGLGCVGILVWALLASHLASVGHSVRQLHQHLGTACWCEGL